MPQRDHDTVDLVVSSGELGREAVVEVPQPGDSRGAGNQLPAGSQGCGPSPLELLFQVAPGAIEGCAGDARLTGKRLDVAGAARRNLPGRQPWSTRSTTDAVSAWSGRNVARRSGRAGRGLIAGRAGRGGG